MIDGPALSGLAAKLWRHANDLVQPGGTNASELKTDLESAARALEGQQKTWAEQHKAWDDENEKRCDAEEALASLRSALEQLEQRWRPTGRRLDGDGSDLMEQFADSVHELLAVSPTTAGSLGFTVTMKTANGKGVICCQSPAALWQVVTSADAEVSVAPIREMPLPPSPSRRKS